MSQGPVQRILVWDAPLRLFHWLSVLSFVLAYATAQSERWRLLHVSAGYTLGGLVLLRLVWGLVGSRYARFRAFVRGPAAVLRYLRSLTGSNPEHHVGHNPAGALAIVLMLACGLGLLLSGWAIFNDLAGEWLAQVHAWIANALLALVLLHLGGVVTASYLHRENLLLAMLTGYKQGPPGQGIRRPGWRLAAVILLGVLGFWWLQWRAAP